ncbi:MAG TPA: TlpA disulfide reductase family protein [Candidatus Sulfotelmatobacter sp.]|nr:TlpA disulfide reductase family protein [Candidatus Sulfotelmatobacter sp.]
MRSLTNSAVATALWLAFSGAAGVQNVASNAAPGGANGAPQTSAVQTANSAASFVSTPLHSTSSAARDSGRTAQPAADAAADQPSQPASLGELARLARAKKGESAKPARVYDDDNFPRSADAGDKAPEISIATALGGSVSIGGSSGKVTLLDFWASWCGPCRQSVGDLKRLVSAYGGDQLEVVSISEDDAESDMRSFVAQNGMTWTQQFDDGGNLGRKYGVRGLPTYVLIGSDGTIINRYVGASPAVSLADRIGPDLKQALEAAR